MFIPVEKDHYVAFIALVSLILGAELFHLRGYKSAKSQFRKALFWSGVWLASSMTFAFWLFQTHGLEPSLAYLTGYFVELALSVDNLFVFIIIFTFFSVPEKAQRTALTYGIVGAILMRAVFIGVGVTVLHRFAWISYLLGALLLFTAWKLLKGNMQDHVKPNENAIYRYFAKIIPSTDEYSGSKFFIRKHSKLLATPLFFVVLVIESTDLMFAVDSIPAIFGITQDPFIVFTSNIFAIICLRSLYFVVSEALLQIRYLNYGLAFVLGFIGLEMLFAWYIHVPVAVSLGIVALTFLITFIASKRHRTP